MYSLSGYWRAVYRFGGVPCEHGNREEEDQEVFLLFGREERRIGCSMIYIHENGRRMKEEDEVSSRRNT